MHNENRLLQKILEHPTILHLYLLFDTDLIKPHKNMKEVIVIKSLYFN